MGNYNGYFDGRVVVVTGAAGGVGKETARQYLEEGAKVCLIDVIEAVADFANDLDAEFNEVNIMYRVMDVNDFDACKAMATDVYEAWGRIDFVASVAGLLHDAMPIKEFDFETWDAVFNVNVKGPMKLCKAVLPYMEKAGFGNVVTVSSWWGHRGYAFFAAYCASKAAMIKFTQSLAEEMAEFGGRANVLCPGNINTKMHTMALEVEAKERGITFEEMKKQFWDAIPLKKPADVGDIADGILFLTSDRSKYMTGATLNINGGCDIR